MSAGSIRDQMFLRLNQRFFYGWVILAVAALGIFASGPGQSHTFSVFVGPISADLGIASTTIASAYGLATLVAALLLPQMGRLVDRRGARTMSLVVAVLLGLACLFFGAAANVLWLGVGFAALRFLGQGSLMLNCANLVSQWFSRKRGFALSLMALGFSASMAVHPRAAQWLIDTVGWREAWVWMGVLTWLLLVPPILLLVYNKPEDLGLRPDGEAAPPPGAADVGGGTADAGLTLREALRTSTFYIVAIGLFSLSMLVTALHFYQVSIFGAHGIGPVVASQVFTISAATMVAAMPIIGRMLDRFRTEWMFAGGLLVMVLSLVAAAMVKDVPTAIAYSVVFGLNNALTMTFFAFLWPRYFGRRHLGSIQGTGQMIGVVGASVGPLPLGIYFDLFGVYDPMLFGLALFPAACAVLALFLRAPASTAHLTGR